MKQKNILPRNLLVFGELLKEKNHIRELAKKTKLNPMGVSRVVESLMRENLVDFEIKGKNKVFFIKNNFEANNFKLIYELYKKINFVKKYPIMREIFEEIEKNNKIKLAILFGSYTKGLENKNSDIDIFIETEDRNLKKEVEKINSLISVKIGLFKKEELLIKEIIENHVIIKGVEEYYERQD